ncbi:MAG TPA: hypothetical protein VFK24_11585 [Gammaproteobacteria bacterium]|nr:hypothetical protein [Gammaproteobacteria bacterium]HET7370841.1 hypothetical protein [Gammaproteobacteria bacterium]
MKRRKKNSFALLLAVAAISIGFCASQAQATPLTFTFSATDVSGTLGSHTISQQTLVVTTTADIADVVNAPCGEAYIIGYGKCTASGLQTGTLSGMFTLGSFSGSFSDPLYVFNNQWEQVIGFGTLTHDLLDLVDTVDGLKTYDLASPFGPITSSMGPFFLNVPFAGTSLGNMVLAKGAGTVLSFQAATGDAVAVPEPDEFGLFGLGLLVLGSALRLRGKAGAPKGQARLASLTL